MGPTALPEVSNSELSPILTAQILLDRARHSPGVIDGQSGSNTGRAIASFEAQARLPVDGRLDEAVLERLLATRSGPLLQEYVVTLADVEGLTDVPEGMVDQSALTRLGYETAREALAEKFHMGQSLLGRLNPGVDFSAVGTKVRVVSPNSDRLGTTVHRIEVDRASSELRTFAQDGTLIASYPATVGSDTFPSPTGSMEVKAVAASPVYYFDPANRGWGPEKRLTIAAGPNNPVGSTWIDLSKDGYGIHGTPEPRLIGKTASHGCVRLTNWDAEELASGVIQGTVVQFV